MDILYLHRRYSTHCHKNSLSVCVCVCGHVHTLDHAQLFSIPWTVAHLTPEDLPDPGSNLCFLSLLHWQVDS